MVKFKATDVKNVGKVQVSAKRLRDLADKLEKVRGTDGNEEIDVYVVPGADTGEVSQLAFDFSKRQETKTEDTKEEKKTEVPQAETTETDTGKAEAKETPAEKKEESEAKEEVKPTDTPEVKTELKTGEQQPPVKEPEKTEVPAQPSKEETQSEVERIAKDESITKSAQEIKEKAYRKETE